MQEDNGWIKLHRRIQESQMYKALNSKQRDIMIQLLLMANHEGKEWMWQGTLYTCQPGQFITSLPSIQEKCAKDVSIQNIRTCLLILKKWQFLTYKSTNKNRLITILNWSKYQKRDISVTGKLTSNQQATNRQLTANKNVKNVKKGYIGYVDENEKNGVVWFETFWNIYPKKLGKAIARTTWDENKLDSVAPQIVEFVRLATQSEQWRDKKFIPYASTFLRERRFEDDVGDLSSTTSTPAYKRVVVTKRDRIKKNK